MTFTEEDDELVQEFYGLDPLANKVAHVALTKSGKIIRWSPARGYITKNRAGDDAKAEVVRLFNLIELVSVSPSAALSQRQEIMSVLEEKIVSKS